MTGSAVPRRMLGRELKKLREGSGVTVPVAARAIEVSPQTLWRMESGQDGPKLKELYVKILCEMYGASEEVTEALAALVGETKKPGWWHSFAEVVPDHFDLFIGLEEAAARVATFQLAVLPGLLQTPEYRQAVMWVEFPGKSPEDLERYLDILQRRQMRLRGNGFELRALLCESILRRPMGGPAVMTDQVLHLYAMSSLPNVAIQIVPDRVGGHQGLLTGSFVMMDFPEHSTARLTEPPVVYMQGYTGALYLDQAVEVEQFRYATKEIQRVALDVDASRQLLLTISREYQA
ncbi:DNA-binding XRE family transcriptional regulator [Nocardia sp. GAS34]|uniref:helix-turn-helix domain-containing protein n=1 Tax=unclassified Nocardia TaxID=2637762 RepID=UPI003D1A6BCA